MAGEGDVVDDEADRPIKAERCRRQLIEALEECGSQSIISRPEPRQVVHLLFLFLVHACGEEEARELLTEQGRPKERSEIVDIKNRLLLDSYDMAREAAERAGQKFYFMRWVREYAEGNRSLPREEQRGAGGIDPASLRQHILTLRSKRDSQRALAERDRLERELADLRRVRDGATKEGDLITARRIDELIDHSAKQ